MKDTLGSARRRLLPAVPARAKRCVAEQLGRQAEAAVAELLRGRGYEILASRLKTSAGEIDLVMANRRCLVFVEVKARTNAADAAYALLPRQQARLLRAAQLALACHADWARPEMRFDVALVAQDDIQIIENALWQG